jgi:hypothetical protein
MFNFNFNQKPESKYFHGCITPEQIKTQYRELAFTFHPDRGGDLEVMKLINAEYHELLKGKNNTVSYTSDNKQYVYKYDQNIEQAVMDKIAEFLARSLPKLDLLLIGNWLWVTGDTLPLKEPLKELKFKWHGQKKCWFWHAGAWHGRGNKGSLADIASKYGYKKYESSLRKNIEG